MRELPNGWVWTTLGEIAEIGRAFNSSEMDPMTLVSFVPMRAVEAGTGRLDASEVRPWQDVAKGYVPFVEGEILFARITPCMENGKVAIARDLVNGVGAGSTEFHVIRAHADVDPAFVLHYLLQERIRREARGVMQGAAGQLRVPASFLKAAPLALPPCAEQRRIVAAIDKQLSELASSTETIRRVQTKLETLTSIVIAFVLSGADIELLPVGSVGEVLLGRQRAPRYHHGPTMRPYLRVANVQEDRIDTSDVKKMNFDDEEFERYSLKPGDVLLNEGHSVELVGRPAMYRGEVPGCCFQKTLLRFRASDRVLPEYALYVFRAWLRSGEFRRVSRWTTNMAHLTAERFMRMLFPLRSLAEQREIVDRINAALTSVEHLRAEIGSALARSAHLRQSILTAAFRGKLVPQDPDDEPASVLLDRIGAARAGAARAEAPPRRATRYPGRKKANA